MFKSPHATNFCRLSTVQWCIPPVIRYHSGRVRRLCLILLGWRVFQSVNLILDLYKHLFEVFCEPYYFLTRVFLVGFNCGLHDDELFIRLVIHIFASFWYLEAWGIKSSITEIQKWLLFGAMWSRWELMSK